MGRFYDKSNKYKPYGGLVQRKDVEQVGPRGRHTTPSPGTADGGKVFLRFRAGLCDCCHRFGITPSRDPHRCRDCRHCRPCARCAEAAGPENACPFHIRLEAQDAAFARKHLDPTRRGPRRVPTSRRSRRRR